MRRNKLSTFLFAILVLFFVSPYLYLLKFSPSAGEIRWDWAVSAFFESLKQASVVVVTCFIFSILLWRSLFSLTEQKRNLIKKLLYAPILMPAIFTILIGFQLIHPFPFGLLGVSILFLFTYFGFFFSVMIETIETNFIRQIVVQNIYAIQWLRFDLFVLLPQLKTTLIYLGMIVFVSCFSSLSIPMIASGGKSTNFELFIYEAVFIQNNWHAAILLSTVQALILIVFSEVLFRIGYKSGSQDRKTIAKMDSVSATPELFHKTRWMILVPITYVVLYYGVFIFKFFSSIVHFSLKSEDWDLILSATMNSISIFLVVACLTIAFSVVIFFRKFVGSTNRFLIFFLNPSTAVVGISFFLISIPGDSDLLRSFYSLMKLSFALFTVIGISFYFSFLNTKAEQLGRQFVIARVHGLTFKKFLLSILFPQMRGNYLIMLSMLFLFVLTEFAVTSVVGSEIMTLGRVLYSYASSYRLNTAVVLVGFVVFAWATLATLLRKILFRGIHNV